VLVVSTWAAGVRPCLAGRPTPYFFSSRGCQSTSAWNLLFVPKGTPLSCFLLVGLGVRRGVFVSDSCSCGYAAPGIGDSGLLGQGRLNAKERGGESAEVQAFFCRQHGDKNPVLPGRYSICGLKVARESHVSALGD